NINHSSYNPATGALTLFGTATIAAYETALQQVTYSSTSDNPDVTTRDVAVVVNDGTRDTNTAHAKGSIVAVNDAPVVDAAGGSLAFTENQAPTAIDTILTVADVDSPILSGASVTISVNFRSGEDVLGFAPRTASRARSIREPVCSR